MMVVVAGIGSSVPITESLLFLLVCYHNFRKKKQKLIII